MLGLFKKTKLDTIYSPVIGETIPLDIVPDKTFSSRLIGDGVAFTFTGDTIYAPCDAKVVMIPKSKHAIGLNVNGVDILIHIGLNTVSLNGEGFTTYTEVGKTVKQGDVLVKVDKEVMKENKIDLTSVMLITSKGINIEVVEPSKVTLDSVVIRIV